MELNEWRDEPTIEEWHPDDEYDHDIRGDAVEM